MKNLIIIGARGWGREVYQAITGTDEYKNGDLVIKGFLDSKSDAFNGVRGNYPPILNSVEDYEIQENDIFFVALGESRWRKYYADIIESKGGHFYTYISPDAHVLNNAVIGEGSYISRWSIVSDNVILGKHVIVHGFSTLGHDVVVKNFSTILSYVFLGGYAEVGELSTLNPNSMIIPYKKIGNNVVVGASSVVMNNIKDGLHVFGNPARKIVY